MNGNRIIDQEAFAINKLLIQCIVSLKVGKTTCRSIEGKESRKPHPNLPAADNTAVVGDSTAGPAAAVVVVQVLDQLQTSFSHLRSLPSVQWLLLRQVEGLRVGVQMMAIQDQFLVLNLKKKNIMNKRLCIQ